CSGWPLAETDGGWVRMGLPLAESWVRWPASRVGAGAAAVAGFATGAAATGAAPADVAPAFAEPSAAACLTSAIVTTPSAPLPRTRDRSTLSLRAIARTAGIALT